MTASQPVAGRRRPRTLDSRRHVPALDLAVDPLRAARPAPCPGRSRRTARPRRPAGPASSPPSGPAATPAGPASRESPPGRCAAGRPRSTRPESAAAGSRRRASAAASCSSAGFISSVWNAPATASRIGLPPLASISFSAASIAALVAGQDHVARTEVVGDPEPAGCARLGDRPPRPGPASSSRTLTMPLGVASAAACIAPPRSRTTRRPSANVSAPANTRAVYSPRLRPAVATHVVDRVRLGLLQRLPGPRGWRRRWPAG